MSFLLRRALFCPKMQTTSTTSPRPAGRQASAVSSISTRRYKIPLAPGRRLCQKERWSRVTEHLRTPPGPEGSNGSRSTGCSGPFVLSRRENREACRSTGRVEERRTAVVLQ